MEPFFAKAGRILPRLSAVTPSLTPSSLLTVISLVSSVLGSVHLTLMGAISSSKSPFFCASMALILRPPCGSRAAPRIRTDTNLNHASLDSIRNLDTGLQTRTALTVQRVHTSAIREACSQSRSTELGGTASRRQYTTNSDILNK
ncbi:hypothetical protein KCU61_g307, partial [Aureobasidium melanogenum]